MMVDKNPTAAKTNVGRVEVYWHTVQYRTVLVFAAVILAIVLASFYLVFPETAGARNDVASFRIFKKGRLQRAKIRVAQIGIDEPGEGRRLDELHVPH